MYFLICIPVVFVYRVHSPSTITVEVEAELGSKLIDVFYASAIHRVILSNPWFLFSQNGHLLKHEHNLQEKDCEQPIQVHRDNASFECEWFY